MVGIGRKEIVEQMQNIEFNLIEEYITNPIKQWIDFKISSYQEWLKINLLDIAGLIAIIIIVSIGLKMFVYHKKEKDVAIIYTTVVCYTVIRLFWRVILHV